MAQERGSTSDASYPIGRGYGHDYMRGGEVLGGYGYSERPEYTKRLGELEDESGSSSDLDGDDRLTRQSST